MRASTKRILFISFSVILLGASIIVFGNYIQPEFSVISDLRSKAATKESLYLTENQIVKQVQGLMGKYSTLSSSNESVNLAIPINPGITQALNQIAGIAQNAKFVINSININVLPLSDTTKDVIKRLGVVELNIDGSGDYNAVKSFIRGLDIDARISDVKNITINTNGSNFVVHLTVDTYYQEL
ncbi:MAG: hypothetical protein ACP5IC_00745 [Minisyncoccia bacterium]